MSKKPSTSFGLHDNSRNFARRKQRAGELSEYTGQPHPSRLPAPELDPMPDPAEHPKESQPLAA
ncbi:MAG: hypothetical protein V4773_14965 [Verrucomicrobiota bacterium]